MHKDAVANGSRVLIVDDLLATGGTAAAAARMVRSAGGTVAGIGFVVELTFLNGRQKLAGYDVFSLLQYDMRKRMFVIGAIALLALLTAASAADLNGKWKGDMKTPDGGNLEINFNFQVNGEKVTGTVANTYGEEQITDGLVKGDAISFIIMAGGGVQDHLQRPGRGRGD